MSLHVDVQYVIRGEYAQRLYRMIRQYMTDGRYAYRIKYSGKIFEPRWFLGDIFSEEIGPGYNSYEAVEDTEESIRINGRGELELHFGLKDSCPGLDGYLLRYFPDMEIYMLYSSDSYGDGITIATNDRDGSVFGVFPLPPEEQEECGAEYAFSYVTLKPDEWEPEPWEYISRPEGLVFDEDEALEQQKLAREQAEAEFDAQYPGDAEAFMDWLLDDGSNNGA